MESSSKGKSEWCNLPSDILLLIANKLDQKYDRQLCVVCTSWNSSFPTSPSKPLSNFPLQIPCPIIPTAEKKEKVISLSKRFRFWVVQRSMLLISPLKKVADTGESRFSPPDAWIVKVEEIGLKKLSLFNPLTGVRLSPCFCNMCYYRPETILPEYINLLDFCVTNITKAYTILWVDMESCFHTHSCSPSELYEYLCIKKIITYHVDGEGMIILLVLRVDEKLAYWKSGSREWKLVDSLQQHDYKFVDITCFDCKFCAVDLQGNFIVIDPLTVKLIKSVTNPNNNCGNSYDEKLTYLVQCEEYLYLVKVLRDVDGFGDDIEMPCFKLVEKGWVANEGFGPKSSNELFFLGNDVSYSLSAKHLGLPRGNFAYCGGVSDHYFYGRGDLPYHYFYREKFFKNMHSETSWRYSFCGGEIYDRLTGMYDYIDKSFTDFKQYPNVHLSKIFWPMWSIEVYRSMNKNVISE